MSARKKSLAEKLFDIGKAIGPVEKKGVAEEGYSFLRAVDVTAAVAPELSKRKILLTATTRETRLDHFVTTVALTYTFEDLDSGEKRSFDWRGQGYDRGGNGLAKAYTAARKSFLKDTFGIVDPEDDPEADGSPVTGLRTAAASTIPADRADAIEKAIEASGLPMTVVGAKLVDLGAPSVAAMSVDEAEAFEAWLVQEVAA